MIDARGTALAAICVGAGILGFVVGQPSPPPPEPAPIKGKAIV